MESFAQRFPGDPLLFMDESQLTITTARYDDLSMKSETARRLTVEVSLSNGGTLQIVSLCPAKAITLVEKEDYTLTGKVLSLCGMSFVEMKNQDTLRLHTQGDRGAYVITYPASAESAAHGLLQGLYLSAQDE